MKNRSLRVFVSEGDEGNAGRSGRLKVADWRWGLRRCEGDGEGSFGGCREDG